MSAADKVHAAHMRQVKAWRRQTGDDDGRLQRVTWRDGMRLYTWILPGSGAQRHYMQLRGTQASASLLEMLSAALAEHRTVVTRHLLNQVHGAPQPDSPTQTSEQHTIMMV